jgi:hypothetical protein
VACGDGWLGHLGAAGGELISVGLGMARRRLRVCAVIRGRLPAPGHGKACSNSAIQDAELRRAIVRLVEEIAPDIASSTED